ncbi:hypothetical protein DMENIID0001_122090 [Sergentomyia squamirostris]
MTWGDIETMNKIQMPPVSRNPPGRTVIFDPQQLLSMPTRLSTRRCLFGIAPPGENLRIAKEEGQLLFEKKRKEFITRFGFDIKTCGPVEVDDSVTEDDKSETASERLQDKVPDKEEKEETEETEAKPEDVCNDSSAKTPRKEISSRRIKPYDRTTKQTHITDFLKVKKTSRTESKEKN